MLRWAVMVVLGVASGCSGPERPRAVELPEERPADFAFAATVYGPGGASERARKPGRYIVEADGVLRVAEGAVSDATTFPGQTRQLTPRQQDQLWRLVRDSGFLEPGHPATIPSGQLVTSRAGRPVAVLYVAWEGTRRYFRVALDGSPDSEQAEVLIDRLASWGWVGE